MIHEGSRHTQEEKITWREGGKAKMKIRWKGVDGVGVLLARRERERDIHRTEKNR